MIRARFWRAMLRKYLPSYVMIVWTDDVSEMCTSDRFVWNARQAAIGRSATERVTVEGRPVRPFDLYPKPQLDAWGRKEIVCGEA
jgi:mannosyltransferase OCH1-like enzyme